MLTVVTRCAGLELQRLIYQKLSSNSLLPSPSFLLGHVRSCRAGSLCAYLVIFKGFFQGLSCLSCYNVAEWMSSEAPLDNCPADAIQTWVSSRGEFGQIGKEEFWRRLV